MLKRVCKNFTQLTSSWWTSVVLLRRTRVPRLSRAADLLKRQCSGLQTPFLLSKRQVASDPALALGSMALPYASTQAPLCDVRHYGNRIAPGCRFIERCRCLKSKAIGSRAGLMPTRVAVRTELSLRAFEPCLAQHHGLKAWLFE